MKLHRLASRYSRLFSSSSSSSIPSSTPVKLHQWEELAPTKQSAVELRRDFIKQKDPIHCQHVTDIPCRNTDFDSNDFYEAIHGVNCENVIGFLPIPIGVIGPLKLNHADRYIPMATTEGALLASVNRGASVIAKSGGCFSEILRDGMTRAPCVELPSAVDAAKFAKYIQLPETFNMMKKVFESTTNHGKLLSIEPYVAGKLAYLRFEAFTGDAMGMNMIGKGVNKIMMDPECSNLLTNHAKFNVKLIALSGNLCIDKKPSAINWIKGRGKSVVCEVFIPEVVLQSVLKVDVQMMIDLNIAKNLIGSTLAGSIGGNNAHASNIVTALYLATGQDPAQNVESSNCLVTMSAANNVNGERCLHMCVKMPSIEVGTVGGGTSLKAQKGALKLLGLAGASKEFPGSNAQGLAQVVAATVLAGEISLNAALCSNQLISAHMKLNRK